MRTTHTKQQCEPEFSNQRHLERLKEPLSKICPPAPMGTGQRRWSAHRAGSGQLC